MMEMKTEFSCSTLKMISDTCKLLRIKSNQKLSPYGLAAGRKREATSWNFGPGYSFSSALI